VTVTKSQTLWRKASNTEHWVW